MQYLKKEGKKEINRENDNTKINKKENEKENENNKRNINQIFNEDLQILLDNELRTKGEFAHHLESFNSFISNGIKQIMTSGFVIEANIKNERTKTPEDLLIDRIHVLVEIMNAELTQPTIINFTTNKQSMLTPTQARIGNLTYSAPLYIDAVITATAYFKDGSTKVRTEHINKYKATNIPIMVGSKCCNTYNKSKQALNFMHHAYNDKGAYFICKGNEWVVDNVESLTFNQFHVYKNIGHKDEICHGDFISKPGDYFENSSELIVKLLTNNNIVFEITNIKLRNVSIPFYILFRALGVDSDKEIVEHICYDDKENVSLHMRQIIEKAFNSSYKALDGAKNIHNQVEILKFMANEISSINANFEKRDDNTLKYFNNNILNLFDKYLLPHIGTYPEHRHKKIIFLGHLVNKLLLVEYGSIESTDRDSYKNKRVHSAGTSMAKIFKTQFNFVIVRPLRMQLIKDFKSMSFSQVPLAQTFTTAINGVEFEKALQQSIITGDKTITILRRQVPNRLSSQTLHRKNDINIISVGRQINIANTSSSKQSERADDMRRAHPSYIGYICLIQSLVSGEGVGMKKQMTIASSICQASSNELMKDYILRRCEN